MNYKEAMEFIKSTRRFGSRPGLERIRELCDRLGNPERELSYIHVTGTNGKGSVCAMLYSTLTFAGMKVGLFTSPWILSFFEQLSANGSRITREEIAIIISEIAPHAEAMDDPPTEFELICAMAFLFFRRRGCTTAIIEAGMGGSLDATNVIPCPIAAIITGVAVDHASFLGNTVEEIARAKAGIIKPGCTVILGEMPDSAAAEITAYAEKLNAPVITTGAGSPYETAECTFGEKGAKFFIGERKFRIPFAGLYQLKNAATAIAALDHLTVADRQIPDLVIRKGISKAKWRARFEQFRPDPLLIFDGCHNPQGLAAVAETVAVHYPDKRFTVITGVMADKDHREMGEIMSAFADRVYTVTVEDNPRTMDAAAYAAELCSCGIDAIPCDSMDDALARVVNDDTLVLGSLYMYKQFIEALGD